MYSKLNSINLAYVVPKFAKVWDTDLTENVAK